MARVIVVTSGKGGVGKTTTALNLGGCFGVLEYKTLLVDADPQANATSGVGLDPKNTKNIYDCLINKKNAVDELYLRLGLANDFKIA
jgi:chromosome partitioning protein